MTGLRDQFGRTIEYLRISVTDRCNFRCSYCMPLEGLPWLPKSDILSYEEIADVVGQLAPLGLRRVRITGGEPTIRPQELADAGLVRVNMSSDSLRPERIASISRRTLHFNPIAAAAAAQAAGLAPIKLNVVVMRGINDDEVLDYARLTLERPWHVRFIELMPVGEMATLSADHVVPSDEVLRRIAG
ncbi:MAG: radical SAM protein [Gemmatimonadetes bacterium]|nr:radical SAM protein [Gemmatimonadota bacterium]